MATIVHFDISAENPDRAKAFYKNLFSWKIEPLPGPMNYSLIETTDTRGAKSIGGGMSTRDKADQPGMINYFGVESIDASLTSVEKLGGKIIQPKQVVPGWGYMAVCLDTENNRFGLFQET